MRITAYRFIMATAALAAGVLAASCSKEPVAGNDGGGGSDGGRTISVSFEGSTKTVLGDKQDDGTIPASFTASDVILVSNGSALEDCKVVISDDGDASITTTLKGELNAVYPPEAAVYLGYNITGFKVPDSQSGRFEDAHICTATIPEGSTQAHFSNETAILKFYVDKSIGVTSIKVTSAGADIATGSKTITVTAPRGKTLADVTDDLQKRICYVAVLPGVNANQLTFTTETTTQPTLPRTPTDDVELEASELFKAFIPYYIDLGDAGKWAYCNIGAFLPEEPGEYFMWGEIKGHKPKGTDLTNAFSDDFTNFDFSDSTRYVSPNRGSGFKPVNAPYYSTETGYSKYNNNGKTVLELMDDAAAVRWGTSWHIPTWDDFTKLGTLITATSASVADDVLTVNEMVLPACGFGQETYKLVNSGVACEYWTSELTTTYTVDAHFFVFSNSGGYNVSNSLRRNGHPIRPILNDAWWYEDLDDGGTI